MTSTRQFRHFVNYHNPDEMGCEFEDVDSFAVVTNKFIRDLIGERVWMIGRRRDTAEYYLYETFRVDRVERGDFDGFAFRISGNNGNRFESAMRIDKRLWFPELFRSMAKFSVGFQRLKPSTALDALKALRDEEITRHPTR